MDSARAAAGIRISDQTPKEGGLIRIRTHPGAAGAQYGSYPRGFDPNRLEARRS